MKTRTCFQKLQQIQKILDSELTHVEKLVLIKMSMYDDCYITNKWLSVTLGTSVKTIEKTITALKNKQIITVKRIVKPGTNIQRRQVTNINFDCLNINTTKTQEKAQTLLGEGLKKKDVSKLQTLLGEGLKLDKTADEHAQPSRRRTFQLQTLLGEGLYSSEQDLENGTTKPTTGISNTLSTYNNLNNKYISKKTISYIMYTQTQKTQKRSDFPVNKSTDTTKKKKRFKKPTVEEIRQYCIERGNTIDPEYFYDWYASRGWFLSKGTHMVDWKASVRTWEYKAKKWKEEEEKRKKEEEKRKKEEEKRKGKEIIRLPIGQARREYTQSWYDKDAEIRRAAVMAATKNDK
ncbi:hypothetical protein HMPREF0889_0305 [Megasphaera lornae]|uniref:Uncharacterized protein n=1 Tax=Megasphaera lornae TaxID=1000568 RepID=D3LVI1_9FIRM|nr:hypothetical protein [Megasphaera genomosp. type_1]EFD93908.1 hypothetical protein HMPREF0889_0305 [Megasphaera genomosp. type_1 str. 28L]